MSTVASLDQPGVGVVPGDEASCQLRIRNDGTIVESYTVEVLGDAASWATAEPATLSIYPGTDERVTVRFRPPRSALILAGEVPFAVRITPVEHPADQVVPEGVVQVLAFADSSAELTPRTSTGRFRGGHEVAIDNRGNLPLTARLSGVDRDRQVAVSVRPATLVVGPGEAAFASVTARPRRLRWRGQPATHPFQVRVESDQSEPVLLDGATVQVPIVPRGVTRLAVATLALVLLAAGLWFGVLRPAVRSTAREAATARMAPAMQQVEDAKTAAEQAAEQAVRVAGGGTPSPTPVARTRTASPSPTASPTPTTSRTPTPRPTATSSPAPAAPPAPPPAGIPPDATSLVRRLQTTSQRGASDTDRYTVPAGQVFVLTDIFLQNPQGDEGRLDLLVNNQTLITVSLANFRDVDYHLVSPIEVPAGQAVSIRASCATPGQALPDTTGGSRCRVFALLGGYQRRVPSPSARPAP